MKTSSRGFSLAQLLLAFVLIALLLGFYRAVHFVSRDRFDVCGVQISPDGKQLTVHSSHGLAFFDVNTGRIARMLRDVPAGSIDFSPDGRQAVIEDWNNYVHLTVWDLEADKELHSFSRGPLHALSFVQGLAVSCDASSNVEIWSLKDGQRLHSITNISEGEFRAAFSPDGTTLAILDIPKSQLSLWDTRSGTLKKSLPYGGPSQSSTSLFGPFIFGPDGQSLVLQSVFEDTTHLWSLGDDSYVSFASAWYSLTPFSPDGNKFAFADPKQLDKSLTVMDVASRQVKSFGSGSPSDSTYAVFAGSHVVVAKWFDRVIAWDVESNQELWNRECESPGRWNDSSLSQDQRKLAVVSDDFPNFVEVWDVQDGRKVLTISHADLPDLPVPRATWPLLAVGGMVWLVLWCLSQRRAMRKVDGRRDFGWLMVCLVVALAVGNGEWLCGDLGLPDDPVSRLLAVGGGFGLAMLACFVSAIWVRYQRFSFWLSVLVLASALAYDVAWFVNPPG